ncbi:hypothetical protein T265_14715, partial [Opisthorchis viverrini]
MHVSDRAYVTLVITSDRSDLNSPDALTVIILLYHTPWLTQFHIYEVFLWLLKLPSAHRSNPPLVLRVIYIPLLNVCLNADHTYHQVFQYGNLTAVSKLFQGVLQAISIPRNANCEEFVYAVLKRKQQIRKNEEFRIVHRLNNSQKVVHPVGKCVEDRGPTTAGFYDGLKDVYPLNFSELDYPNVLANEEWVTFL